MGSQHVWLTSCICLLLIPSSLIHVLEGGIHTKTLIFSPGISGFVPLLTGHLRFLNMFSEDEIDTKTSPCGKAGGIMAGVYAYLVNALTHAAPRV